ncbi:MAG: hypothetical protein EBX15_04925 [Acidimicrobiia bacterium]|nr:hypothetical protein [Acidimicrobiia bacterium]
MLNETLIRVSTRQRETSGQHWSFFWDWDPAAHQVRWMTAWDVSGDDVARFAAGVEAALQA